MIKLTANNVSDKVLLNAIRAAGGNEAGLPFWRDRLCSLIEAHGPLSITDAHAAIVTAVKRLQGLMTRLDHARVDQRIQIIEARRGDAGAH